MYTQPNNLITNIQPVPLNRGKMYLITFLLVLSTNLLVVKTGDFKTDTDRSFLFKVYENQEIWKPIINVIIDLDMTQMSVAVKEMLQNRQLGNVQDSHDTPIIASLKRAMQNKSVEETLLHNMTIDNEAHIESKAVLKTAVISISVWNTIEHIVLEYHADSDMLKFGQTVFVTAIRCYFLWIFRIMIQVINISGNGIDVKQWFVPILNYMLKYQDAINQLDGTLSIDNELCQKWTSAIDCYKNVSDVANQEMYVAKINQVLGFLADNLCLSCYGDSIYVRLCGLFKKGIQEIDEIQDTSTLLKFNVNTLELLIQHLSTIKSSENIHCAN